jgi:hypothetical protein
MGECLAAARWSWSSTTSSATSSSPTPRPPATEHPPPARSSLGPRAGDRPEPGSERSSPPPRPSSAAAPARPARAGPLPYPRRRRRRRRRRCRRRIGPPQGAGRGQWCRRPKGSPPLCRRRVGPPAPARPPGRSSRLLLTQYLACIQPIPDQGSDAMADAAAEFAHPARPTLGPASQWSRRRSAIAPVTAGDGRARPLLALLRGSGGADSPLAAG